MGVKSAVKVKWSLFCSVCYVQLCIDLMHRCTLIVCYITYGTY